MPAPPPLQLNGYRTAHCLGPEPIRPLQIYKTPSTSRKSTTRTAAARAPCQAYLSVVHHTRITTPMQAPARANFTHCHPAERQLSSSSRTHHQPPLSLRAERQPPLVISSEAQRSREIWPRALRVAHSASRPCGVSSPSQAARLGRNRWVPLNRGQISPLRPAARASGRNDKGGSLRQTSGRNDRVGVPCLRLRKHVCVIESGMPTPAWAWHLAPDALTFPSGRGRIR